MPWYVTRKNKVDARFIAESNHGHGFKTPEAARRAFVLRKFGEGYRGMHKLDRKKVVERATDEEVQRLFNGFERVGFSVVFSWRKRNQGTPFDPKDP